MNPYKVDLLMFKRAYTNEDRTLLTRVHVKNIVLGSGSGAGVIERF